jgi:mono/diheme cytochrome c family protein
MTTFQTVPLRDDPVKGRVARTTKILIGAIFALILTSSEAQAETRLSSTDRGQRMYQRNCLHCHGVTLDGKGPAAASLSVPPANFHTYRSRMKDDAELEKTIKQGKRFLGMHNWGDTLTEEQVDDLIAYIRSAAPHVKGNSEEGRKIYNGKGFCFQCHGYEGYIDRRPQMGPDMRRMLDELDPKPADHRNPVTLQSKNDQERFDTIRKGHPGTAMFPRKYLSDENINDLVAYLSVLRSEGKRQVTPSSENRK